MMDIDSRAYCKTNHVGRLWNSIPKIQGKGHHLSSKNVTRFPKKATRFLENVIWFPQKRSFHFWGNQVLFLGNWFIFSGNQVTFSGNQVTS